MSGFSRPGDAGRCRSALASSFEQARVVPAVLVGLVLGCSAVRGEEGGAQAWMPPEVDSADLRGGDAAGPRLPVSVTSVPKSTADATKFTRVYTIELEKFGIRNDGTHPAETSKGLNAALQHAKSANANRIVFPPGQYLISESDPVVLDHKDAIVDLNGATLQMNTNGLPNYAVVQIVYGAENLRLTNGTIRGDRETHDYKTQPGTHEGGACLAVVSGSNLEIDHMELTKGTGDGVMAGSAGSRTRPELLARIYHSVRRENLEPGGFSEKGEKVGGGDKVRTINPYEIGGARNRFELGYLGGYQGFPWIKGRAYQVYFFDRDNRFLEKKQCLQYRKVEVPAAAGFAHFEFNQPGISDKPAHEASSDWLVRINNFTPPTDVHFHHNLLAENRRLGMANMGQRWLIEENRFERNGGTPPAFGIDLEDGWELMQDVVIRKNSFKDNVAGDLVICAGSELLVEDNDFQKSVVFHGRPYNYTVRNNRFNGGSVNYGTRTGVATIENNRYAGCKVTVNFDGKGVADGLLRAPGQAVSTPPLLLSGEVMERVEKVGGTYLNFKGGAFRDTKFEAGDQTLLVHFEGCKFENSSIGFSEKGPDVAFQFKGNTGELPAVGPGVKRKIAQQSGPSKPPQKP